MLWTSNSILYDVILGPKMQKNLEANQKEAYKKTWMTKRQLLMIHDFFNKKGKENKGEIVR